MRETPPASGPEGKRSNLLPAGLGWGAALSVLCGLARGFGGSNGVLCLGPLAFLTLLVALVFLVRQLTVKPRPYAWRSLVLFLLALGSSAFACLAMVGNEISRWG